MRRDTMSSNHPVESLFQITSNARNRLSPAGGNPGGGTSMCRPPPHATSALRPSPRVRHNAWSLSDKSLPPRRGKVRMGVMTWLSYKLSANVPRTPQRTPRSPNLAHTRLLSRPVPRKNRHFPAPPVPRPCPIRTPRTANHVPTPASLLPTNPPRSGKFVTALEIPVHPCYPRSREGQTPRPGIPTPTVGASLVGALWVPCGSEERLPAGPSAPCPDLSRGATSM